MRNAGTRHHRRVPGINAISSLDAGSSFSITIMVDAAPPQQKEKGAAPKTTVLANVVAKATAVVVVVGLSLVVHAYRRTLVPLYGVAPVDLHLNKIVWAACIIGSFAPTVPVSYATLVTGVLLCLMPNTAYWAAVYTGRMGDPVWGPVYTHLAVALPLLATGVAVVKSLQVSLAGPLAVECGQGGKCIVSV